MDFTEQQTAHTKKERKKKDRNQMSVMDFMEQQTNTAKKGQKSDMDFTEQQRKTAKKDRNQICQ